MTTKRIGSSTTKTTEDQKFELRAQPGSPDDDTPEFGPGSPDWIPSEIYKKTAPIAGTYRVTELRTPMPDLPQKGDAAGLSKKELVLQLALLPDLSHLAFRIATFMLLGRHHRATGECIPTAEQLAEALNVSEKSIQNAWKELRKTGLLLSSTYNDKRLKKTRTQWGIQSDAVIAGRELYSKKIKRIFYPTNRKQGSGHLPSDASKSDQQNTSDHSAQSEAGFRSLEAPTGSIVLPSYIREEPVEEKNHEKRRTIQPPGPAAGVVYSSGEDKEELAGEEKTCRNLKNFENPVFPGVPQSSNFCEGEASGNDDAKSTVGKYDNGFDLGNMISSEVQMEPREPMGSELSARPMDCVEVASLIEGATTADLQALATNLGRKIGRTVNPEIASDIINAVRESKAITPSSPRHAMASPNQPLPHAPARRSVGERRLNEFRLEADLLVSKCTPKERIGLRNSLDLDPGTSEAQLIEAYAESMFAEENQ